MDPAYADHYRQLYRRHWWWRSRETLLVETIRRAGRLENPPDASILDIGCGDGFFFPELLTFGSVWGIEPDRDLVSPDNPWIDRITIGSFPEDFVPHEQFDLIVMADVLEHVDDPVSALRAAVDALTPAGRMLVTVPAFPLLWTAHDVLNHHRRRYTKASLDAHATSAGARILESRYLYAWLAPLKLVARGLEAVTRRGPRNPGIPPEPVNGWLARWSRLEHRVATRISLPFGSSLLAILERASGRDVR